MSSALPDFERPPIDEVVIGVQFEPLKSFRAAHFGLYWSRIRSRYPNTEEQVPIVPMMEGPAKPQLAPQVLFGNVQPRCWFLDASKTQLIQVQNDRFIRNWRKVTGDEEYPRYSFLIEKFREEWEQFLQFVELEGLGPAKVNQCELTYINQIEPGSGWKDFSELEKVFTTVHMPRNGAAFLPTPELMTWEARYNLPDGKGRLHVQAQPAFRNRDFKLIENLALTARGAPEDSTNNRVYAWFELAHEWIVRGFDQLTQPQMHQHWGKK
ncbi:MAG: TIGR04255 family protein [Planctomycetes bacterium]|nr:TIGR04255 family protein [Planctomycetota bacterium]